MLNDPTAAERMRRYRARQRAASRGGAQLPGILEPDQADQAEAAPLPDDPARAIAAWSAFNLVIPPGHPNSGQPLILPGYAVDFIDDALGEDREALLCIARKNAKSAICAAVSLAFICGPMSRPGQRLATASLSKDKAKEFLTQATEIAEASNLPVTRTRSPYPGALRGDGGQLEVLAAEKGAGHASGFDLVWADELGLFPARARDLVQGLRSSVSARNGRFIALSVRGDSPLLEEMLDRDGQGVAVHHYAAPDKCDLDDRDAQAAANPGLRVGIKSWDYMAREARRVALTPADEPGFRAFDLNQRQTPNRESVFSSADLDACFVDPADLPEPSGPVALGFDMGGGKSMSAACAIFLQTGLVWTFMACGDDPDLATRGRTDNADYVAMRDLGQLWVYEGCRVTPVAQFVQDVAAALEGLAVDLALADSYKYDEVLDAMDAAGVSWPVEKVAFGARSFRAVRTAQNLVIGRKVRMAPNLALVEAVKNSSLNTIDRVGNQRVEKAGARTRIDVLSAFVLASLHAEPVLSNPDPAEQEFFAV